MIRRLFTNEPLRFRFRGLVTVGLMLSVLTGCGDKDNKAPEPAPGPVAMTQQEHEQWEIALVEMRIEKNDEFSAPVRSPLPAASVSGFEGLNYYFPAPELRFSTSMIAAAGADTVLLTKRRGQVIPYIIRGTVRFGHDGRDHQLTVFGPADSSATDYLFLPFFDQTSGGQTYAGGRYLDLEVGEDGMVDLDFNYAYNPLCDYNPDRYNCTLPPAENRLPFAVKAGEMIFGSGH